MTNITESTKLSENIKLIKQKIADACRGCGMNPADITLIAATKTISAQTIKQALECGITDVGENRVQEFLQKHDSVNDIIPNPQWHFIGHLQKNKAKYIVGKVALIHSVDSLPLALEINRQAKKIGIVQDILIQVNIMDEESKFGVSPNEYTSLVEECAKLANIKVLGLMSIPPLSSDNTIATKTFQKSYKILLDISSKKYHNVSMSILSMGMSGDFEQAIMAGATHIRIGSAIFGERGF